MWLGQTYDFARCVIVFTIYGDQMDPFWVGHESWDDREASVAYVALLRKYCRRIVSFGSFELVFLRKRKLCCFSLFSYTGLVPTIDSTMVVSI